MELPRQTIQKGSPGSNQYFQEGSQEEMELRRKDPESMTKKELEKLIGKIPEEDEHGSCRPEL